MSVVFCVSRFGGPEPRVLARFVTDDQGLHTERVDRQAGRWVHDARVAGFLTGQDDWAERVTRGAARQVLQSWGYGADLLDAPVAQVAAT